MEVTILGAGGAFTDFRQEYHTSAVVSMDSGKYLIDCGGTTVQAMMEAGIDYLQPDLRVFITHMHADHIGGLEQLIYERYYMAKKPLKTTIYTHWSLASTLSQWLALTVLPFTDHETGNQNETLWNIAHVLSWPIGTSMRSGLFVPVTHCGDKPCVGLYLIGESGKSIYWSGDSTRPQENEQASAWMQQASLIFHECSFTPAYPGTVHTHYEQLLELPDDLRSRMVLIHHGPKPEGLDPMGDGFHGVAHKGGTYQV
jgi:ribonuclease BN (tRNA processing enzyme)